MSATTTRLSLGRAGAFALALRRLLAPFCEQIEIAGSVRRGLAGAPGAVDVGDVELVVVPRMRPAEHTPSMFEDFRPTAASVPLIDCLAEELDRLHSAGRIRKGLNGGGKTCWGDRSRLVAWPVGEDSRSALAIKAGFEVNVDIWWALPATFGWQMVHRTGPNDWAKHLVTARSAGGLRPDHLKFDDGALWSYADGGRRFVPTPTEEALFAALGLPLVEVKDRRIEQAAEVAAASGRQVTCRVSWCENLRRPTDVICRSCWKRVPVALQREIWRLFKAAPGSLEHVRAVRSAVKIAEGEGAPA